MRFDLEIDGDRQISRRLLGIGHRGQNASPAFHRIIDYLRWVELRQFDTQGKYASGGWAKLKESTIERKAAAKDPYLDPRILRATEALMKSLTQEGDENELVHVDHQWMIFGTKLEYAKFHQRGWGVTQRRPVELTELDRRRIVKTLQRFLVTGEAWTPGEELVTL